MSLPHFELKLANDIEMAVAFQQTVAQIPIVRLGNDEIQMSIFTRKALSVLLISGYVCLSALQTEAVP